LASAEPSVRAVAGPLDDRGLGDVARLYGAVDVKYARMPFLRNLLAAGPAGPALHVFADAGGAAVGHCCVVPQPARMGGQALLAGKVEAFAVEEPFRETSVAGRPLAITLLERLYELSDERRIDVLHAYATPELGLLHRLLGFRAVEVGEATFVGLFPRAELTRGRGVPAVALAFAQAGVRVPVATAFRVTRQLGRVAVRAPDDGDADLVETPATVDAWTVAGEAVWDWHRASNLVRVVEAHGRWGSRALIQNGAPGGGIQVLAWRPSRAGIGSGLAALAACAQLASRERAAALRYQPWRSDRGDGGLARAARLLGLVQRRDLNTLYVRSSRPELAAPGAVELTPFLYATF
jgi:hypothetical protein